MPTPSDDRLMWEAYKKTEEKLLDEGFWDRVNAKSGTRMANLGSRALGGLGKLAGNTRMGKALTGASEAGQLDVQEKRAQQLMSIFSKRIDAIYNEMKKDAGKIGIDIDKLAMEDYTSKGTGGSYPKLAGLSEFLRHINDARRAISGTTPPVPPTK